MGTHRSSLLVGILGLLGATTALANVPLQLQLLTGLAGTVASDSVDRRQLASAGAVLGLCRSVPCSALPR